MVGPRGAQARSEALIDLAAVRANTAALRAAASGADLMAVVKAGGYGHGAVPVARAALAAGARRLGVATLDEALDLRAAGITAPLLCWLLLPDEDYAAAVAADVDLSVSSREHLAGVLAGARRVRRPARIHLKIDTGLSRGGAPPARWADLLDDVAAAGPAVEVAAVWSHLAHGEEPEHPVLARQVARLDAAWRAARAHGWHPQRHLANSAALLTRPDLHFDTVRAGIALYGLDPRSPGDTPAGVASTAAPTAAPTPVLTPVMTLTARVALVKQVTAGEGVSYGHAWIAPGPTTLALLPIGYGDGVPRRLNARGRMTVLLAGARRPVVGRIAMDQLVVDCGDAPVRVGQRAVLFGTGTDGAPTAAEWAQELDTIHYEVVTGIRGRVRRTYLHDPGSDPGAADVEEYRGSRATPPRPDAPVGSLR